VSDKRKPTIFVVDDEPHIAQTTAAVFHRFGFFSRAFTNPLDALQSADSECPDLLLSDVVMPEMSGIELAIKVSERLPRRQILLFPGQTETSDLLESAREAGRDFAVLAKPIHPTDLLAAIDALLPKGAEKTTE
jgi:CheY-like chemotaxis protein